MLWGLLRRKMGSLLMAEILASMGRTLIASAAGGAVAWGLVTLWNTPASAAWWLRPVPAIVGSAAFAVVFVVVAWAIRSRELEALAGALRRKLSRRLRKA